MIAPTLLVTSCSSNKHKQQEILSPSDNYPYNNADAFFPKLYIEDYYDFIEFDKNAQPFFGDKFIMKVIEDVVTRVSSDQGIIKFSVNKFSEKMIDFNFWWTFQEVELFKSYSFELE